jgi:hypothetical protein
MIDLPKDNPAPPQKLIDAAPDLLAALLSCAGILSLMDGYTASQKKGIDLMKETIMDAIKKVL